MYNGQNSIAGESFGTSHPGGWMAGDLCCAEEGGRQQEQRRQPRKTTTKAAQHCEGMQLSLMTLDATTDEPPSRPPTCTQLPTCPTGFLCSGVEMLRWRLLLRRHPVPCREGHPAAARGCCSSWRRPASARRPSGTTAPPHAPPRRVWEIQNIIEVGSRGKCRLSIHGQRAQDWAMVEVEVCVGREGEEGKGRSVQYTVVSVGVATTVHCMSCIGPYERAYLNVENASLSPAASAARSVTTNASKFAVVSDAGSALPLSRTVYPSANPGSCAKLCSRCCAK